MYRRRRNSKKSRTVLIRFFNKRDPYFSIKKTEGYTRRAKKYGYLKVDYDKRYSNLKKKLKSTDKTILDFGDYVFIKLPYIDNYINSIVKKEDGWFNNQYIKKEKFTVNFIKSLIEYKPLAINRQEIKDYQEKELPIFLNCLKDYNIKLYQEAIKNTRFEN